MLAHPDGVWSIGADFSILPVPAGVFWAEGSGRRGSRDNLLGLSRR